MFAQGFKISLELQKNIEAIETGFNTLSESKLIRIVRGRDEGFHHSVY